MFSTTEIRECDIKQKVQKSKTEKHKNVKKKKKKKILFKKKKKKKKKTKKKKKKKKKKNVNFCLNQRRKLKKLHNQL